MPPEFAHADDVARRRPTQAEREAALAAALLDAAAPVPDGLLAPGGGPVGRRFAVHRATSTLGSIAALAARHPVLERLLGADTFADLARAFLRVDRPRTALLLGWGDSLPDFVAAHPDLAAWPWLADVARLEVAWTAAHHAADAVPLTLADLVGLAPDALAGARVRLHPSLRLVETTWAVAEVWAAGGEGDAPDPTTERLMVLRPDADVVVDRLDEASFAFLGALAEAAPLSEAALAAARRDEGFDVGACFVELVRLGAVATIDISEGEEDPT